MFGNDPIVSIYNEPQSLDQDADQGEGEPDPYICVGLSDEWTALMAETFEDRPKKDYGQKKRRSHEDNVSLGSHHRSNFIG